MRNTPTWVSLSICALIMAGCLSRRMTAVEVVNLAQQAWSETRASHFVLDVEMDTDLIKDSLSVEVWEAAPERFKVVVLSAQNPQLRQLAFATDGTQSVSFLPHTNEVTIGPADLVKMPFVLETAVRARKEWVQAADAHTARVVAIEREEGLVVYRIEIPLARNRSAQFWIDARDWLVRKVTYEDDYLGKGTVRVRDMQQLEGLPDATFELSIPDGVPITEISMDADRQLSLEEAQMAVSFPLRKPAYLPSDTELAAIYQIDQNIAMVFQGAHPFTLVQGLNIGAVPQSEGSVISLHGQQATLVRDEQGGGLLLIWRDEELWFSLAGLVDQEELVRIAESVE